MYNFSNLLGDLSPEEFLQEYWHKKPLLVRQAMPGFTSPISPDELAGLACEPEVESRLVLERGGDTPWALEHGPFEESRFGALPESHWTLLVQECNKYLPELAELLEGFNFIPNWRIDDIMVSYAPDQGSVGPHMDQYDVFLIQGLGKRHWQISTEPVAEDNLIPGLDLRIMREFTATDDWVLEPGDMLYLPPAVAHHGMALGDCMTLSVGFRAPAKADMISGFATEVASRMSDAQRYADPGLSLQAHPGEISGQALGQVRQILHEALADDAAIHRWFGQFITEPKWEQARPRPEEPISEDELLAQLPLCEYLERSEYVRFAYIQEKTETLLFIDGHMHQLPLDLAFAAPLLCDHRRLTTEILTPHHNNAAFVHLLTQWLNAGYVFFPQDE
jgi:50S ribosomal protein L16 3-hydroxylase